jgi:hypothetical protein
VAQHNKADDLFIVVQNKVRRTRMPVAAQMQRRPLRTNAHVACLDIARCVRQVYDVTDFSEDHPGGGIQHPAKVWDMIQDYYVGEVKKDEHVVYTFKVLSKL